MYNENKLRIVSRCKNEWLINQIALFFNHVQYCNALSLRKYLQVSVNQNKLQFTYKCKEPLCLFMVLFSIGKFIINISPFVHMNYWYNNELITLWCLCILKNVKWSLVVKKYDSFQNISFHWDQFDSVNVFKRMFVYL